MTMSLFAQTVAQSIADYRLYLRKSKDVDQASRVAKLTKLNLKDVNVYSDDVVLFNTAQSILSDIRETIDIPEQGYYSYSGIAKFYQFLNDYLVNYEIDGERVVHRAQRASRAILEAIQIINGKPAHVLNNTIKEQVYNCHNIIVNYGNDKQLEVYRANLLKLKPNAPLFYTDLLRNFDVLMFELRQAA